MFHFISFHFISSADGACASPKTCYSCHFLTPEYPKEIVKKAVSVAKASNKLVLILIILIAPW